MCIYIYMRILKRQLAAQFTMQMTQKLIFESLDHFAP